MTYFEKTNTRSRKYTYYSSQISLERESLDTNGDNMLLTEVVDWFPENHCCWTTFIGNNVLTIYIWKYITLTWTIFIWRFLPKVSKKMFWHTWTVIFWLLDVTLSWNNLAKLLQFNSWDLMGGNVLMTNSLVVDVHCHYHHPCLHHHCCHRHHLRRVLGRWLTGVGRDEEGARSNVQRGTR